MVKGGRERENLVRLPLTVILSSKLSLQNSIGIKNIIKVKGMPLTEFTS